MDFNKKLKLRVVELDLNKAKAARSVGLPDSTISSYLAKPGSVPRADIALKIARALDVPLDWLVDDDNDWPPPERSSEGAAASQLSHEELMLELAIRCRIATLDFLDLLESALAFDWSGAADDAQKTPPSSPLTDRARQGFALIMAVETKIGRVLQDFDVEFYSVLTFDELPNRKPPLPLDALTGDGTTIAYGRLLDQPAAKAFADATRHRPELKGHPLWASIERYKQRARLWRLEMQRRP